MTITSTEYAVGFPSPRSSPRWGEEEKKIPRPTGERAGVRGKTGHGRFCRSVIFHFCALILFIFSPITITNADAENIITCDVHIGACIGKIRNGTQIEFDIQPKPVAVMKELTFIVHLMRNGKPVKDAAVLLDLTMPGMYMGKNQPLLKQTDVGRYEGKGIITRCMSNGKTWQAEVTVVRGIEKDVVDFVFEVK